MTELVAVPWDKLYTSDKLSLREMALVEPLNDDRRDHTDEPAQKIRHPRDVRILPPSRDFH